MLQQTSLGLREVQLFAVVAPETPQKPREETRTTVHE